MLVGEACDDQLSQRALPSQGWQRGIPPVPRLTTRGIGAFSSTALSRFAGKV
jgi:hypothetical protein